jgi:hypothetical protein
LVVTGVAEVWAWQPSEVKVQARKRVARQREISTIL